MSYQRYVRESLLIYTAGLSGLDSIIENYSRMPSNVYWDSTLSRCTIGTGWTGCYNSNSPSQDRTSPNPHTIVPLEQGGYRDEMDWGWRGLLGFLLHQVPVVQWYGMYIVSDGYTLFEKVGIITIRPPCPHVTMGRTKSW